jgi:uncharacterized protein YbaP (TraB family)
MRWFGWLLAVVLVAACTRAPEPSARPALWRATDGDTVVWLFGTIHLLPEGELWRTGPVARAIAESDTLITEIPDADPQRQAATFLGLARVPGLPPLAERVPADRRAALAAAVAASGVPQTVLDRMATWAAALTLTSGAANGVGGTRTAAPEAVLSQAFAGKRHDAFETFEGQLKIFAALPEEAQRKLLAATIDGASDPAESYQRLLSAWRRGDMQVIAAEFDRAFTAAPELQQALVTQRNVAWADELKRRAARPGTILVAVGAGHMTGTSALPALLSARGFRVARVQ